jgi:ELMO/CED-12 family
MLFRQPRRKRFELIDAFHSVGAEENFALMPWKEDEDCRNAMIRYLQAKYDIGHDPTPYDSSNLEHEEMLMLLWDTLSPSTPLEARVGKQWASLGFQGTFFVLLFCRFSL